MKFAVKEWSGSKLTLCEKPRFGQSAVCEATLRATRRGLDKRKVHKGADEVDRINVPDQLDDGELLSLLLAYWIWS